MDLFIDSNYYCAYFNGKDSSHLQARKLGEEFSKSLVFCTSTFVLLESYTIISQRVSKKASLDFGEYMRTQNHTRVINMVPKLQEKSWEIFKQIEDKNISYVDASIIAVMQDFEIPYLVTFDKHFSKLQTQFNFKTLR